METLLAVLLSTASPAHWPAVSRLVAERMVQRYGPPDDARADLLRWRARGPFNEITVYRDEDFTRRSGVLEQKVSLAVPVDRWRDLSALDVGVVYDSVERQLAASAESEPVNLLALNVAVDVIDGRRSVDGAKEFYRKTLDLSVSGKSSRYMRRLLFAPAKEKRRRRPAWLQPLMP